MNGKSEDRILKDNKNRHAEYYGMQAVFDELYKRSDEGKKFKHLMRIITSKDNILLAYRNIKRNKGSYTPSVDRITIETIERMSQDQLLKKIENRLTTTNQAKFVERKFQSQMEKQDRSVYHRFGIDSSNNVYCKSWNQFVKLNLTLEVTVLDRIEVQNTLSQMQTSR